MSEDSLENRTAGASRRALFAGAGAVGVTVALAACGSDDGGSPSDGAPPRNSNPGGGNPGGSGNSGGSGGNPPADESVLADASDIEVGGGVVVADRRVVITQPSAGEFRGFSAICTHEGCLVSSVSGGTINCLCHGSRYSIEDGSVVSGAVQGQAPLPEVEIEVDGSEIRLA